LLSLFLFTNIAAAEEYLYPDIKSLHKSLLKYPAVQSADWAKHLQHKLNQDLNNPEFANTICSDLSDCKSGALSFNNEAQGLSNILTIEMPILKRCDNNAACIQKRSDPEVYRMLSADIGYLNTYIFYYLNGLSSKSQSIALA
jgi:hypothetical protein